MRVGIASLLLGGRGWVALTLALVSLGCNAQLEGGGRGGAGGRPGGGAGGLPFLPDAGPGRDGPLEVRPVIGQGCVEQTQRAERVPLDLYLMLDASYSMLDPTQSGASKWEVVKGALRAFMADPRSAGLGLGLQVFPVVRPDVVEDCYMDGTCGNAGPCLIVKTCAPGSSVRLCDTNADCPVGTTCQLLGGCTLSDSYCTPVGGTCGGGAQGTPTGNSCAQIPGYCQGRDRCEPAVYAAPAVPIAELPGAATAVSAALDARAPSGRTPLGPALAGAITHARERATSNPGRKVAVVLASDGLPVVCAPQDVPGVVRLAEQGLGGTPSVPTFALGVVSPAEAQQALLNLRQLATAGGTGSPFLISTAADVQQELLTALDAIRTSSLSCELRLPAPPPGAGGLDFGRVNVVYGVENGPTTTIVNVAGAQACDPMNGGWHYDVDPTTGARPTAIVTCPATCARIRSDEKIRVSIELGCQSVVE